MHPAHSLQTGCFERFCTVFKVSSQSPVRGLRCADYLLNPMNLQPVPESLLRLGEPLPAPIRDPRGNLLLPKGGVIDNEFQLRRLMVLQPHVQPHQLDTLRQPWVQAIGRLVLRNETLGRIAEIGSLPSRPAEPPSPSGSATGLAPSGAPAAGAPQAQAGAVPAGHAPTASGTPAADLADRCAALRIRLGNIIRAPLYTDFEDRLLPAVEALRALIREDADGVLLVLLLDASEDMRDYGLRHSLVVATIVALVAQEHPESWPADSANHLICAALTMNLSILQLQDQMALQTTPLAPEQRERLATHGGASAAALRELGVTHADWLYAVEHHHAPPAEAGVGPAWASLIHKADVFAAAISPRRTRPGLSATSAARATFLDRSGHADAAGSWIVKTVGLYPPGTLVALNNDEMGVVCRRGQHPASPWVAALVAPSGNPLAEPVVRDTARLTHRVVRAVPMHEARVRVPLSAVLARRPAAGARTSREA